MKIVLMAILAFTVSCKKDLSLEEIKSEITRIEEICTPKVGSSKEEIEMIFGTGAQTLSLPNGSVEGLFYYQLCDDGELFVRYNSNGIATESYFANPYEKRIKKEYEKGKFPSSTPENELKDAKERLNQLRFILEEYKKINHKENKSWKMNEK